jgi:hypothetical protein
LMASGRAWGSGSSRRTGWITWSTIRSRLEALLSGTEGELGEIGRLVAEYEENRHDPVAAPRARTEPEPPPAEWRRYVLNRVPPPPLLRPDRQYPANSPGHGQGAACSLRPKSRRRRTRPRRGGSQRRNAAIAPRHGRKGACSPPSKPR